MRRITTTLILVTVLLIGAVFTAQATAADAARQHLLKALRGQQQWSSQGCSLYEVWSWIECVREAWIYEKDHPGERCQQPSVSSKRLRGDCDDFAVMVAYYLQEYWHYDTYIVVVYNRDTQTYHAIAFLHASKAGLDSQLRKCGEAYQYQPWKGRVYIPVDWSACPDLTMYDLSRVRMYEWNQLAGKP